MGEVHPGLWIGAGLPIRDAVTEAKGALRDCYNRT